MQTCSKNLQTYLDEMSSNLKKIDYRLQQRYWHCSNVEQLPAIPFLKLLNVGPQLRLM